MKKALFITLLFFTTHSLSASEPDTLFRSDKVLRMELRADFTAIQNDRGETPAYHNAELSYKDAKRKIVTLPLRIMVRGNFRRNPDNCNFPPLYFNFKKSDVHNTLFEDQDKIKLVTPCKSDEYVIEEYVIYKMYNRVTDLSLHVRLVKIEYYDTGLKKTLFEKYSFFIEDKDHAAKRNNAVVKDNFLTPFDLERENFKRMAMFQFLIGNKDWFVSSRKNIIIFQPKDTTLAPYAVPYDFDFSAFVNADYTKPRDRVDIFPESRRTYKGLCYSDAEYKDVFDYYRELRTDFYYIIRKHGYISAEINNQIIDYINQFYNGIKDKEYVTREFIDKCETKKMYNIPEI
ncbi:MAG: hypothetical protein IPJ16_16010 [Bacteroidales bacterium]|nr:hypothetical protein [Bacteroidales bacterium]